MVTLSPFLFKFYIDDIITAISSNDFGCKYGFMRANLIDFADYLFALADTSESLSILYAEIRDKLETLDLLINQVKTKCCIFSKVRRKN